MRRHELALLALCSIPASAQAQTPLGTAFTYQGRLDDNGQPASGPYDLRFTLFDAATNGNPLGTAVVLPNVPVAAGLFTVSLDFGIAFAGDARWLEIGVKPGGSGGQFTILSPRQELTPSPISEWSYSRDPGTRHVGPMAQDFRAAFGLGADERHIATVDADGVALAAIQALLGIVEDQRVELAQLKARVSELESTKSTEP